jgi:hypothetical protein
MHLEQDVLVVEATSPGQGWVAVGFHDAPDLAGSRLMMAARQHGTWVVEEHVPSPPMHPKRTWGAVATAGPCSRDETGTSVTFRVPLNPKDPALATLRPGEPIWLVTAWSHDDDFGHHSAQRTARWGVVPL